LLSAGASFYNGEFFKWGDELSTAPTLSFSFVDGGTDFYFDDAYLNDAAQTHTHIKTNCT
jgi:hypothetical protein